MNFKRDDTFAVFFIPCLNLILLVIVYLIIHENYDISDRSVKRYVLILFVIISVLILGIKFNSFASSLCFIFPITIILQRSLIELDRIFHMPYLRAVSTYEVFIYLLFLIMFIMFLIKITISSDRNETSFAPMKYFLMFFAFGVMSLTWSVKPAIGIVDLVTLVSFPMAFFVFNELFRIDTNGIVYFIRGVFLSVLVSVFFIWPEFFGIKWFSAFVTGAGAETAAAGGDLIRPGGLIGGKANFAIYLAMTIPFLFAAYILRNNTKNVNNNILLISMVLFLLTLAMTLHRMQFTATILGVVVIFYKACSLNHISHKYVKSLMLIFIFSISLIFIVTQSKYFVEDVILRDTLYGRLLVYKAAWLNFMNSKGLGVGLNNLLETKETISLLGSSSWTIIMGKTVHNDYLKVISELGIVGILLFLAFLYKFITFENPKNLDSYAIIFGAKISLIVLSIISLTDVPFNKPFVWIFLGIYGAIFKNIHKYQQDNLIA